MLKLGGEGARAAVREAFAAGGPLTVVYDDVLQAGDIREVLAGIRDAGAPPAAVPLLAWLASHPNAPEDVLRELASLGGREVLMSLAMNRALPADLRQALLSHADDEVRLYANHVHGRMGLGRN